MFKRIALHTFVIHRQKAMISTVQLCENLFETMVMFSISGEELESVQTHTLDEARKTHSEIVRRYDDMLYNDSIDKCLGFPKRQYITPVVTC